MKMNKKLVERTYGDGEKVYIASISYQVLDHDGMFRSTGKYEASYGTREEAEKWIDEKEKDLNSFSYTEKVLSEDPEGTPELD